ncbi:trypsin-like peptidase domain-containing protein [Bradyrhizobium erythrophlei]|uniref:trypsin-like peptidase domain-containing protein n=1 Tax=Bradyrhizobium erythrophlei TaxID=1437360 RepID=UPI0035E56506
MLSPYVALIASVPLKWGADVSAWRRRRWEFVAALAFAVAFATVAQSEEARIDAGASSIQTLRPLVKRVIQTVVSVSATIQTSYFYPPDGPGSGFPDGPLPITRTICGAGVMIDAELGLIVTSNHLVKGAETTSVLLFDGRRFDAGTRVVDEDNDLAILKIEGIWIDREPDR